MKEFVISSLEAGQRLDKYLQKLLPNAEKNFIYKMLRKKNIVFNEKKANGNEKLVQGDAIKIYFTEETFNKFARAVQMKQEKQKLKDTLDILFENEDYLFVNKPSGMLSQKADAKDTSLVDIIQNYLIENGCIPPDSTFKSGICNRLDRNTSGIVAAGKSIYGLQKLSEGFRQRTYAKYYITLVKGCIDHRQRITGYLRKDSALNKVHIISSEAYRQCDFKEKYNYIETEYIPVVFSEKCTLLKVHLLTGKSHQIRAHLAYVGHQVAGDIKYGDRKFNQYLNKRYGICSQMLHAYELCIPQDTDVKLKQDIVLKTDIPILFRKVLKGEDLWEHGIPEVLGALH